MSERRSALTSWTPEQRAAGRRWVQTWRDAAERLEEIRRSELRSLDSYAAIARLCGDADYLSAPRAPRSTSGLVQQQAFFQRLRRGA